jgi:hypothetical protein
LRPSGVFAAGLFLVNLPTFGAFQRVALQVERLIIGGNTGVADAHGVVSTLLQIKN